MRRALPLVASFGLACSGGDDLPQPLNEPPPGTAQTAEVSAEPVAAQPVRAGPVSIPDTLVRAFVGHDADVTAVTVSPDGTWIASGGDDGLILVWDVATGTPMHDLEGHRRDVIGLAASPDGSRLVSTSLDQTTRLWNIQTGIQERLLREELRYNDAAFSPDGSILATGVSAYGETHLWDPETGELLGNLAHGSGGGKIAFSHDGLSLIMGISNGVVAWDALEQEALWQVTGGRGGESVAIDPTGALVAFEARTHVALVDTRGQSLLDTLPTPPGSGHLVFTPTGQLAMASGRTVRVWDVHTRAEVASISGAMGPVSSLAVSSDGSMLVAGSEDGAVWAWDLPGARLASELGMMPWGLWDGPVPSNVGVHCDRRYGPGGILKGVVLDSVASTPVEAAEVNINECKVLTDPEGAFLIVGVDPGRRWASAYKPGWRYGGLPVESLVNDTTRVTLRIHPKATCDPRGQQTPHITSAGPEVSLHLGDVLQSAVDSVAPGFVPYGLEKYHPNYASFYSLQCDQAPSAVIGDFNGDGVSDLAAVGRAGDQHVELLLISSADGYLVVQERRTDQPATNGSLETYYEIHGPGEVYCMEADPGEGPLVLTTQGVHVIYGEKASALRYWREGEWRTCTTGD